MRVHSGHDVEVLLSLYVIFVCVFSFFLIIYIQLTYKTIFVRYVFNKLNF